MKKLVVVFVSLAIQAMVTLALADTVPSLATYGADDGWTIIYKGTSGNDSREVSNYYFPDGIPGSWNTLVSKPNGTGWIGPGDDDANKFWVDTIEDSTTKATNIPRVPQGQYAYTIELGDFVEGETWILTGGFATDNILLTAIVWSHSSVTPIIDELHRNEGALGTYNVLGEGIVLSDLLSQEAKYFLTLTILNTQGGGPGGSSPQGLLSWLDLSKTSAPPAPTPEPATLLILGLGAAGAGFVTRRRMSK